MENRPHMMISSRNIPSDTEDRYLKWYDEAYIPIYLKMPGYTAVENYRIIKKTLEYPGYLSVHHAQNRSTFEESKKNPNRDAMQKDMNTTFYRVVRVWHDVYALIGSFRNDSSPHESTIVENAPIIHIEGYRVPPAEQGKYDQWFIKWASSMYIPLLMKSPGLKAYNCFKLSDLSMRLTGSNYIEAEIPSYVSFLYFENMESFENYEASLEYAVFKRNLELEFPNSLSTIWNVQYQLRKSWRK